LRVRTRDLGTFCSRGGHEGWAHNHEEQQVAEKRVATLLQHKSSDQSQAAIKALEGYELGKRRSLEQYIELTGVDTKAGRYSKTGCVVKDWVPWAEDAKPSEYAGNIHATAKPNTDLKADLKPESHFKEEEEQEQEDQGVACYEADVIYQPIDIPGHAREKVDSVLSCQQRCAEVKDCGYANYFPDGGCHLSGRHANKEPGVGTLSGPARCMGPRKTSAGKTSAKAVKNRGSKASILVSEELIQAKAEAQQHYARVSHIGDTDMGPIDQSVAISASMHIVGRSLWMHSGLLSLAVGLILGARFMLRDAKEIEEKGS